MGGGGHFGLFIGPDLMRGSTDACETYGSVCLAGSPSFDVVNIEVYGFGAPAGLLSMEDDGYAGVRGRNRRGSAPSRPKGLAESLEETRDYDHESVGYESVG